MALRSTPALSARFAAAPNSCVMAATRFLRGGSFAHVSGVPRIWFRIRPALPCATFFANCSGRLAPTMGDVTAYKGLAIIVLGGLGSIPGTVLGALLIGIVETMFIGLVEFPFPRDAWAFLAMIAVFLLRPQGLLGR